MASRAIEAVLPHGVHCVVTVDEPPADFTLLPTEKSAIARAVPKRQAHFMAGRHCARSALTAAGWPAHAIARSANGAPCWPAGVIGSICHCDGLAAAIVGQRSQYRGLGIDIEPIQPLSNATRDVVLTRAELAALPDDTTCMQWFCAKEALYKALAADGGEWLDFSDITLSPTGAGLTVTGTNLHSQKLLATTAPVVVTTHWQGVAAAIAWCGRHDSHPTMP